jgi:hypothetical protein
MRQALENIMVPAKTSSACSGPMDRRTWLKVGGLSFGALAAGVQPSLARLMAATEQAKAVDRDFSVILFFANGGPSHIDMFDLKPAAPAECRGPFKPIATNVPGLEICELLPSLAGMADKYTLLRSLHHERNEHSGGTHRFLTGYASRAANLQDAEYPEIGSVVAQHLADRTRDVPLFVANSKFYGGGPAYLGQGFSPYMPTPDPATSTGNNKYDPVPIYNTGQGAGALAITPEGVLTLHRRTSLLRELDVLPRRVEDTGIMSSLDAFHRQAVTMLASPRTREAFDLTRETEATRRRYGETHWGESLLTCRRLVEAGSRFVQCQAAFRLRPETGRITTWDDHSVNSHIFKAYEEKLPSFDQSVSALIDDLYDRGLDRSVLFIFCGEFGRTPQIRNQDPSGRPGRDHWSRAMSVLLAGGGLKMGQVIGATNSKAEEPVDRAMDSNCLLATIYQRFGIDPSQMLYDQSNRPHPILPKGEPIRELI